VARIRARSPRESWPTAPFTHGQIAAIAHADGLALVTINVKDFARFKELDVTTNWSTARGRE
jgi:predicted nucleic acid-binding protein